MLLAWLAQQRAPSLASSAALDQQCSIALRQQRVFKNISRDNVDILTYLVIMLSLTLITLILIYPRHCVTRPSLQNYNQFSQQGLVQLS